MILELMLFILGLVMLIKGADYFVKGSAAIAEKLGISELIIGLTLVAIGTSVPELGACIVASIKQESGIVIGNVIGSNIANMGLIIGISAAIYSMKTHKQMLRRDGYIMLAGTVLFYLFILDRSLHWIEGGLMLLIYGAYVIFLFEEMKAEDMHFPGFVRYFFRFRYLRTIRKRMLSARARHRAGFKELLKAGMHRDSLKVVLGAVAVASGAHLMVEEAIFFAAALGISTSIIAITMIALGTSLPELSVSITAARKGYGDIAVGNIIGSNIANLLLVAGSSSFVHMLRVDDFSLKIAVPLMLILTLFMLVFIRASWRIKRVEGIAFFLCYVIFIAVIVQELL